MYDVYWAAPMFSAADWEYNDKYVQVLRDAGIRVYNPMRDAVYIGTNPSDEEIFQKDVAAVKDCRVFVANIDQESIDSGVASQIGIASLIGKPIVGVFTDSRRDRPRNNIYKNPHVMGAIKSAGELIYTMDDLVDAVKRALA